MKDEKLPPPAGLEHLIFIRIPHVASGVLFVIAAVINIVNVIGRYVFATPIFWAEEVLIFIVIWTVFLLAGSITYRGAHLNMDLIYSAMPPAGKRFINILVAVTLIGSTLFVAKESWKVVALHYGNGGATAGTDIPLFIPHAAVLFGFLFMAAAAIVRVRSYIAGQFE